MKLTKFAVTAAALVIPLLGSSAQAGTLFFDSLQGNLNNWTSNGDVSVQSAPDGTTAAGFTGVAYGSDLLTKNQFHSSTGSFTVKFDFYGNCGFASGCGAFLATDGGGASWILSDTGYGSSALFPDSLRSWQEVSYTYSTYNGFSGLDFENWGSSPHSSTMNGSPFFLKNVLLTDNSDGTTVGTLTVAVPEPGTWALMMMGLGGLGMALRHRRNSALVSA